MWVQISLLCPIYQEVNIGTNNLDLKQVKNIFFYFSFPDDAIRKSCLKNKPGNRSSTSTVDSSKHVRIDIKNEHTMI